MPDGSRIMGSSIDIKWPDIKCLVYYPGDITTE